VTVAQTLSLSPDLLGGQQHWVQNAIGWCAMPLALALPTRVGAGLLLGFWSLTGVIQLVRSPGVETLVNLGLGTASILTVQVFALVFNGLMREAAVAAHAETESRLHLMRRERVAAAVRDEYQRRYAALVDNVVPLLQQMSGGSELDETLRRRARSESRLLRALFAQETTFDNPLMGRLRPLIDTAEERGVDVVVDIAGELPSLTESDIDCLAGPLSVVLESAVESARLVVTTDRGEVTVSVVCRAPGHLDAAISALGCDVEVVRNGDTLWLLARRRLEQESRFADA
jgi:hypothetical protein